jgi:hypothetical protein
MPVTISRAQRDAIYEMVINHLTAIGDVWMCVDRRQYGSAERVGREFAEDLRLLEDLGWAEHIDRENVALTSRPRSSFVRSRGYAGTLLPSPRTYVSRPKDEEERAQRDVATSEGLGETSASSPSAPTTRWR